VLGFGVVRAAHLPGWRGLERPVSKTLLLLMFYELFQSDLAITGCPIGAISGLAGTLKRHDPQLAERFVPGLCDETGKHLTAAMFLSEKAGGSDVGANETIAVATGDGTWRLFGEKWFASCPHSDLALVSARPEGAGPGSRGLGFFLVPRTTPDGERNAIRIHRLKDKFASRSMATGEVGLDGAFAWPVGDISQGMKQALDFVNMNRAGVVAACAGAMRRGVFEALEYSRHRIAFGRPLIEQPLMCDMLAELVVDSVAGLSSLVYLGEILDRAETGDTTAASLARVLTGLFKMDSCERARRHASDAAEVRGANGLVEDWPDARMIRDVHYHSIGEGPANVMALSTLGAIAGGHAAAFFADVTTRAENAYGSIPLAPLAAFILDESHRVAADIAALAGIDPDAAQLGARRLTRRMAEIAIGARLLEEARAQADENGSGRLTWIAARYIARVGGGEVIRALADDPGWLPHAEALLEGRHVPLHVGEQAATLVADALRQVRRTQPAD